MVKKMEAFLGTPPFFLIPLGVTRARAASSKLVNLVRAWSARMLRSARKSTRGRRVLSLSPRHAGTFHLAWKSFQTIWKATGVLPVPVAIVSGRRSRPAAMPSSTASTAFRW